MNRKTKYNPRLHHRRSIRLKAYDYSQAGLYFITICCHNRACLFGKILDGKMILNDAGRMVETQWFALSNRFPHIVLHDHVIMPNHFHVILEIVGATLVVAQNDVANEYDIANENIVDSQNEQPQGHALTSKNKTVGDILGAFKSIVTVEYMRGVKNLGWPPLNGKLWQRNYYEHIIRDEHSHKNISNYILNNPAKWATDKFYNK